MQQKSETDTKKQELAHKQDLIRCTLCGHFEIALDDDSFIHKKNNHENYHEGMEQFVVGRDGSKKKRASNRITGKVKWIDDNGEYFS